MSSHSWLNLPILATSAGTGLYWKVPSALMIAAWAIAMEPSADFIKKRSVQPARPAGGTGVPSMVGVSL